MRRQNRQPQSHWSLEQTNLILGSARGSDYYPFFHVLARTGLRVCEAKRITWDDFDSKAKLLHVRPDLAKFPGEARDLPVSEATCALLATLPRRSHWLFAAEPAAGNLSTVRPINERRAEAELAEVLSAFGLEGRLHSFRSSLLSSVLTSSNADATFAEWAGLTGDQRN